MKIVIQKAKIKVITPSIIDYYCDRCDKKFKKGEKKRTWSTPTGNKHYHIECNKLEHPNQ